MSALAASAFLVSADRKAVRNVGVDISRGSGPTASTPGSVMISLTFNSPEVRVLVVDDGRPPAVGKTSGAPALDVGRNGGGHGVLGMAERAAAFDGSLVAGPRAEGGWQVAVTLRGCKAPALL